MDLLGEGLVDFLVELGEIGFANVGFEDVAVFVDQDGSRVNLCAKGFCGSFVGIVHDGEGKAVFFDVLMDVFNGVDGLGNAEDLKIFALIILGGFDDFRHLAHAAGAGGKPEVNEGNFVFQIGVGNGFALQVGQREIRGGFVAGDKDEGKKCADRGNDKECEYFFMIRGFELRVLRFGER